jgi:[acyl-carrier-protein] S-malonyltransferase
VGMGKEVYNQFDSARKTFEEANDTLGFDLAKLCFEGSFEALTKTENAQPSILTVSVAMFRSHFQNTDIIPLPHFMAGHSLGEYTALVCCGAMRFEDAVKIVRKRGELMQEAVAFGKGAMASVNGMDEKTIEDVCADYSSPDYSVCIAGYNSKDQIVISGNTEAVNKASEKLTSLGANVIPLKVSAPFHSSLMQPAATALKMELSKYKFNAIDCQVISNVTGLPYKHQDEIIENLTRQMTAPVRWHPSMEYLIRHHVFYLIECGPKKVLRNLLKSYSRKAEAYAFDDETEISLFNESLKRNMKTLTTLLTKSLAMAISTKNHNWNDEDYHKKVIEPFRKVKDIQERLELSERLPSKEEMNSAVAMLGEVLAAKKIEEKEIQERLHQLFLETGTAMLFPEYKF